MKQEQEDRINARGDESPSVDNSSSPETPQDKPKHAGGRKPKGYYERGVADTLAGSAPDAARLLDNHMMQRKGYKKMKDTVLKAAFFIIDHAIGKARQKVEHSGGVMTYGELAKSAEGLEKKPRPILAEVMEIAHKYQAKTPEEAPDPGPSTDELK